MPKEIERKWIATPSMLIRLLDYEHLSRVVIFQFYTKISTNFLVDFQSRIESRFQNDNFFTAPRTLTIFEI